MESIKIEITDYLIQCITTDISYLFRTIIQICYKSVDMVCMHVHIYCTIFHDRQLLENANNVFTSNVLIRII